MLALTTLTALLASASIATAAVVAPRADTTTVLAALTAAPQPTKLSTFPTQPQGPTPTKVQAALAGPTQMTLTIANKAGRPVTTHHYHNAHTPTLPSPPAAPTPGVMADGQSMHYVVPLGYGGTMMVSAGEMLGQESQLEYTFETQDGINKVALDISYFKAYSFSMVCTCSDGVKTGCDIPLFAKHQCVSPDYVNAAGACVNAAPDAGPASPFFADCKDKAYVYTFNDLATNNGNCLTGDFTYEILPNGK